MDRKISPAVLSCGIHLVCFLAALILFSGCGSKPAHDAVKSGSEVQRVVVIGDIHADLGAAREAFQLAGGIDEAGEWVGGEVTIVQLGDMIGRSYEDREVLDFIQVVSEDARRAGGAVFALVVKPRDICRSVAVR